MAGWVWPLLVAPGAVAAALILPRANARASLVAGGFLAALDLVVENAGASLGLWTTRGALLSVGVTPIEVVVLAFLAGASLGPFLSMWPYPRSVGVGLLAVGGAGMEGLLRVLGLVTYGAPWSAVWAFVAYLLALHATDGVYRLASGLRWASPRPQRG